MKQSDIAALILVVALTVIASFFIGNQVISTPEDRTAEVEVVEPISTEFPSVDREIIFVEGYVNPTALIRIGETGGDQPFQESD